jgi:hypothetical protein
MRNLVQTTSRDTAAAPAAELTIPAGRHPVPTQTKLHTRRVPVAAYVLALLVIPAIVVAGFMSAGLWATTGKSVTSVTAQAGTGSREGAGNAVAPVAPVTPADVKGSMTVHQVVDAFPKITAAQILAQLKAPPNTPAATQLKELVEAGDDMDIPALRTWLQTQLPPQT